MKTSHSFSPHVVRTAFLGLLVVALIASAASAQTFTDKERITESPTAFQASVYAVGNEYATIRISVDNTSLGPVQVQIVDQDGRYVYSDFQSLAQYRQRFDLSAAPFGTYTVLIRKRNQVYSQTFRLEPPKAPGIVTLSNHPSDLPLTLTKSASTPRLITVCQ